MREMSESLPVVNPDVVSQRVGDDLVLVHLKTNQIFSLNPTGGRFWELLAEGRSRAEIERTLHKEFDVEPEVLRREIDALVADLARQDIIRET